MYLKDIIRGRSKMEQRKKVLITNLYFQKFTGSELHVLEFAHLFKEKGYDVVIAVYKLSLIHI